MRRAMTPSASRTAPTDSKSYGNHLFAGLDSDDEQGNDRPTSTSALTPVNKTRRSQRRVLRAVSIETPGDFDRNEYDSAKVDWAARKVLREVPGKNEMFQVLFEDGKTRTVSRPTLNPASRVLLFNCAGYSRFTYLSSTLSLFHMTHRCVNRYPHAYFTTL